MASISYALRNIRATLVQVATLLLCFLTGLALDHFERLGPTIVVLTVVMGMNLGRTQRYGALGHRLVSLAALPFVSVGCVEVGRLFVQHPNVADALFTGALGLSIYLRRFGPWGTRLGTLVALPFIALLVTPVPVVAGPLPPAARSMLWSALAAVFAYCWVWIAREAAQRLGLVEPLPRHPVRRPPAPAGGAPKTGLAGIPASTRMAVQMTLSLALAFVVGRTVFAPHWAWIVLTAFIVNSGNRGRGDVVHKSLLRVLGAGAGTIVATLVSGLLPPRDNVAIVIILIVLAIGIWLRTVSYVYWAGCVTSVLSLVQGYFGEGHAGLIGERLLQIVLGGALAVLVAWFVLPVRSEGVVRRRIADCLAPLTDLLIAALREPAAAAGRLTEFAANLELLEQVAPSTTAHRRLHRLRGAAGGHPADAIEALCSCASAAEVLAQAASQSPQTLREPGIPGLLKVIAGNVAAARKAIGRRPDASRRELPAAVPEGPLADALLRLDAAARVVFEVYFAASATPDVPATPDAPGTPATPVEVANPPARPLNA